MNSSSPSRAYYADHNRKMSHIAGGNRGAHLNDYVSPYSVLRGSTEGDVENMIGNL